MWEFIHFWWHNIRSGWSLGSGIFAALEMLSVVGAIILGCLQRFRHKKEGWESVTMKVAVGLLIISFLISTGFVAPYLQYKNASDKSKVANDLKASVLDYRYNNIAHELTAQVQFANNGKRRRTVLEVIFTYRSKQDVATNQHHYLRTTQEYQSMHQVPVYVEPGQPIVQVYSQQLHDENLINTPGVGFGLDITTIRAGSGATNDTYIETMIVIEGLNNESVGTLTERQNGISLDSFMGQTLIENRVVPMTWQTFSAAVQPSVTPSKPNIVHEQPK
jgi:hypothetical protein